MSVCVNAFEYKMLLHNIAFRNGLQVEKVLSHRKADPEAEVSIHSLQLSGSASLLLPVFLFAQNKSRNE
jgi:hypothetical protein